MPPSTQAILAAITDIARLVFDDDALELTLESTSDDVPGWDSMNHITLVVEAECRFNIHFGTVEVEELKSVGELVRAIQKSSRWSMHSRAVQLLRLHPWLSCRLRLPGSLPPRASAAASPGCWLIAASLFFYGWWNPRFVPLLLISIVANYAVALLLHRLARGPRCQNRRPGTRHRREPRGADPLQIPRRDLSASCGDGIATSPSPIRSCRSASASSPSPRSAICWIAATAWRTTGRR